MNIDCNASGQVRMRALGSGGGLEVWSEWYGGNSTNWLPAEEETDMVPGDTKQVVVEVEMRRSPSTSHHTNTDGLTGPTLFAIRGQFVLTGDAVM